MKDKSLSLRVLIVEDSEDDELLIIRQLKKGGYNPVYERVETAAAMKKALNDKQWDIILCDYSLPKFNALSAIAVLKNANIDIPLIIVSGTFGEDVAVECMRLGAHDFVMKDNLSRLCPAIARDLDDAEVRNRHKQAESQREAALEALKESEKRYRRITENMSDMVSDVDAEGLFQYISPSHQRILGYKPEDLLGTVAFDKFHPDDKDRISSVYMEGVITKTDREAEYRYRHADGHYIWLHSSGHIILDGAGEYVGSIINSSDITKRKLVEEALQKSEKKYHELSIIDDRTQLYNSRHFYTQLEIEIERSNRYGQPFTLLLMDLDKFKKFNDKYGHVEGDYVLSQLGQVIKRCLRDSDSAYRYGGEEFTIMLPMTTCEEGIVTAKRIQTELRKEAFSPVPDKNIYMTLSIGLAQYKPKEEMKKFVQRVDKLMYQAKKEGRNRICPES